MTKRLYYTDTFLHEFEGSVENVVEGERPAVVLDQTAFYPTSGGQVFDKGKIVSNGTEVRVQQVEENEKGEIIHYIDPGDVSKLHPGQKIRGVIDASRRRDHMQQHSGQHVLSAAFEKLYQMPTVSFHMGEELCTIDLATGSLIAAQLVAAEKLANEIVLENRPVQIKFAPAEQADKLGLRKIPEVGKDELRLIEIEDFDLCACGGTHVTGTGQIGPIFVRKFEKVKQGFRVEFVCGDRALKTARKDFETLSQAAGLYSSHLWEVPKQIEKSLQEIKAAAKAERAVMEELAEYVAGELATDAPGRKSFTLVKQVFEDRELSFVKLVAQKLSQQLGIVALLGCTRGQPTLVFSRSADVDLDVSALLKETLVAVGGRGGGTKDLAQGGVPNSSILVLCLEQVAAKLA
jgi:alanyl-tRNA synthetase